MNEIRIKFRSERGASITFALLLFLVCAVVGSVILVAATAASGRLSQLAESDQRYYSVTSAAELLKGKLHNQSVTVVTTTITETTKTYKYDGTESGSSSDTKPTTITINGFPSGAYTPNSLLTDAAYKLKVSPPAAGFPVTGTIELSASDKDTLTAFPSLDVIIKESLEENGTITLILKNKTDEGSTGNIYSLQMILQAEQAETTDTKKQTGTPTPAASGGYTIKTTQTTALTTTLTWKVIEIATVVGGS